MFLDVPSPYMSVLAANEVNIKKFSDRREQVSLLYPQCLLISVQIVNLLNQDRNQEAYARAQASLRSLER